jgi:hypothetical protein
MNEAGLSFDWYAGYSTNWTADPSKTYFNGDMCKEILKKCTTVEEVIEYYNTYNEPAFLHARPMYIDRNGHSIILKWIDGKVQAEFRNGNYQLMGAKADAIKPMLEGQTNFTLPYMANMLDLAHQEGDYPTQYSNIYDTYNSKIYLFSLFDYSQCILIDLKTELGKGQSIYNIKELFTSHELGENVIVDNLTTVTYYDEGIGLQAIIPNPFTFSSTIQFTMQKPEFVSLKVFNLQGQLVKTLINQNLSGGQHQIILTDEWLSPEIYYFRLKVGSYIETRKILFR